MAFCRWLSAHLDYEVRLLTEWEWQQAATGGDPKNVYPWGRKWSNSAANTHESKLGRTTAVGMYPTGATKQGVMDLAGNVWEWCLNKYENPGDTDVGGDGWRVLRGSSWEDGDRFVTRTAVRLADHPRDRDISPGFRVARYSPI